MTRRRTDRTAEEKRAVKARRKAHQAIKKATKLALREADSSATSERQEKRKTSNSRKKSEAALARRPKRARTARREMQRAIAKAQRILEKKESK